jgi:hypothetical protein
MQKTSAPKVILVAHSMGGLICRSMIAQVLKEKAEEVIAKVVTYGTPHGGVEVFGRELDGGNFSVRRMFEYLHPKGKNKGREGVKELPVVDYDFKRHLLTHFDAKNFLCIVGTNAADYDVAGGFSRWFLGGPDSDGLVKIKNAAVLRAPDAHIHRSHSGRFGMVNSSEGYESMERFLFGGWRGTMELVGGGPGAPPGDGGGGGGGPSGEGPGPAGRGGILPPISSAEPADQGGAQPTGGGVELADGDVHLLDADCSLGPLSLLLSSRRAEHYNAIELTEDAHKQAVPIHVFHLLESDLERAVAGEQPFFLLRLSLRLRRERYRQQALAQSDVLMEQPVEVRVTPRSEAEPEVRYRWPNTARWPASTNPWTRADRVEDAYVIPIPVGRSGEVWGYRARLHLKVDRWNEGAEDMETVEELVRRSGGQVEEVLRRRRRQRVPEYAREPVGVS